MKFDPINYFSKGKKFLTDPHYLEAKDKSLEEKAKNPSRTEIINYLLSLFQKDTSYLEIGVRNPEHNFFKSFL